MYKILWTLVKRTTNPYKEESTKNKVKNERQDLWMNKKNTIKSSHHSLRPHFDILLDQFQNISSQETKVGRKKSTFSLKYSYMPFNLMIGSLYILCSLLFFTYIHDTRKPIDVMDTKRCDTHFPYNLLFSLLLCD